MKAERMSSLQRLLAIIYFMVMNRYFLRLKTKEHLQQRQKKKLKNLFEDLKTSSVFFARCNFDLENWRSKLPVMDKSFFMDHLSEINSLGLVKDEIITFAMEQERRRDYSRKLKNVTVGLSSGTSGHRGVFMCTDFEMAQYMGVLLAKAHPGPLLKRQRVALFLRANSNLYTAGHGLLMHFQFFNVFDELATQIAELEKFNPTMIIAPASGLRALAEKKANGGLQRLSPERIYSAAEVLDPIDEVYVQKIFAQKIHQIYQCTEGFLAISCRLGRMHLNEENLIIDREYLDAEKKRFIPIITDLYRRGQPIVRYRLNDILSLGEGLCACGSPTTVIDSIDGRQDDTLYFKAISTGDLLPVYPDFLRRCVLLTEGSIDDYYILQESSERLEIRLMPADSLFFDRLKQEIENLLLSKGCLLPLIEMEKWLSWAPGQKKRRVQRAGQSKAGPLNK